MGEQVDERPARRVDRGPLRPYAAGRRAADAAREARGWRAGSAPGRPPPAGWGRRAAVRVAWSYEGPGPIRPGWTVRSGNTGSRSGARSRSTLCGVPGREPINSRPAVRRGKGARRGNADNSGHRAGSSGFGPGLRRPRPHPPPLPLRGRRGGAGEGVWVGWGSRASAQNSPCTAEFALRRSTCHGPTPLNSSRAHAVQPAKGPAPRRSAVAPACVVGRGSWVVRRQLLSAPLGSSTWAPSSTSFSMKFS